MTLIKYFAVILILFLAIDDTRADETRWKKLNREQDELDEFTDDANAQERTFTTEKVKREISTRKKGRVIDIDIDAVGFADPSSFGKSVNGRQKQSRSKFARIAASIDDDNAKDEVKGRAGAGLNMIVARKRRHEDSFGNITARAKQNDSSPSESEMTAPDQAPGQPQGQVPGQVPGQSQSQSQSQGQSQGQGGQAQINNSMNPGESPFEPVPNGGGGIGTAVHKSESDQQQIQESGNKNVHEVIPMGIGGSLTGQRQENSVFQKQTSSQRTRSESLIPVAIGQLKLGGFGHFGQIPQMPSMSSMPQMPAMQGMPQLAVMATLPQMPSIRLIRSVSDSNSAPLPAHPGSRGAHGTDEFEVEDDPKNRDLERIDHEITDEEPANFAPNAKGRSLGGTINSINSIFDVITGPDTDDTEADKK